MTTATAEKKPETTAKAEAPAAPKELHRGPIEIGRIEVKSNIRKHFEPKAMQELTESIGKVGVLQPIILRYKPGGQNGYVLVAGERRLRAARTAGLLQIPATVLDLTDSQAVEIQVVENAERRDLHPLEEAEGYRELLAVKGYDAARIAERVGRSVHYVYDRLKLLSLTKDLQKQFLEGKFSAGHAVILSRLSPEDQKRAADEEGGGLWEGESLLWDPRSKTGCGDTLKPSSVRELQAWVDQHVRFDPEQAAPYLFQEAAEAFKKLEEKADKVVSITLEHYVQPEAREGDRIIGPRSWLRADGKEASKACDHSVLGVIVAGPGRGEAFRVCIAKEKCSTHWGKWQRERKAARKQAATSAAKGGGSAEARWKKEQENRERRQKAEDAMRKAWGNSIPDVAAAVRAKIKTLPVKPGSELAKLVEKEVAEHSPVNPSAFGEVKTSDDFVRWLAFIVLVRAARLYHGYAAFPKHAARFGVDLKAVLAKVKAAAEEASKKGDGAGKSS